MELAYLKKVEDVQERLWGKIGTVEVDHCEKSRIGY